jgi:hypothetical protein
MGLDLLADIDGDDIGALLSETNGMASSLPSHRSRDERNTSSPLPAKRRRQRADHFAPPSCHRQERRHGALFRS